MGTPNFKKKTKASKQALDAIPQKDRRMAVNLVSNFIATVPREVMVSIAEQWELAPLQLQRDLSIACTVLAADAGSAEAKEAIRRLRRPKPPQVIKKGASDG